MNNYYKYSGLSKKVQAIKRNEEVAVIKNNKTSSELKANVQETSKKIRRLFLIAQGELNHLQNADAQTFNDLFNFYRNEVYDIKSEINDKNEAWPLLEELTSNIYFTDDKAIESKQDFYERVVQIYNFIDGYID